MEEVLYISEFVFESSLVVLPLFLLSIGLGILVNRLELTRFLGSALDARPLVAVLLATAIGAFSPFCSCTVIGRSRNSDGRFDPRPRTRAAPDH